MDEEEEDSKCCDWEPSRPKKMRKLPSSIAHASIISRSNSSRLTEADYQKYMELMPPSSHEKETIEEVKTVLNNIKEGRSSELLWIHKQVRPTGTSSTESRSISKTLTLTHLKAG